MQPTLVVREACEHNLRAVSLDLPHESLVAVSHRCPEPIAPLGIHLRVRICYHESRKQGE